jgi:hypothetical protein
MPLLGASPDVPLDAEPLEVRRQAIGVHLEDALRPGEILEPLLPEIAQNKPVGLG